MTNENLVQFIQGATTMGSLVIALFFARFWLQSRDVLFAYFALAFAVFASNRAVLSFLNEDSELRGYLYLVRLLAFLLILGAIIHKNRPSGGGVAVLPHGADVADPGGAHGNDPDTSSTSEPDSR